MSSFLEAYQRQPKLFIDLPSKGKFYQHGNTVADGQSVQIPVFGMNAMDEILFKTPDALFTGKATADVIHSCNIYSCIACSFWLVNAITITAINNNCSSAKCYIPIFMSYCISF